MERRFTAKPHLPANHCGFRLPAASRPCVRSLSHRRARARLVLNAPAHRPWQASLRSPFPRTHRRARFVCQRSTSTSSLGSSRPRARGIGGALAPGPGGGDGVPVVGAGPPPAVAVGGRGRHLRHGAAHRRARPLPPHVGPARRQAHGRRRQKQLASLLLLIASLCGRSSPPP